MAFYQTNQRVLAEFWASSNPNKKISGTLEIFENGEVEISTPDPFEDKLLNIKREPIATDIIDPTNLTSNLTYYYRKDSFSTISLQKEENNKKISKIKTKFNNDDEIPEFDWVAGKCEFGYFKFFSSYKNLNEQKSSKYSTYNGFDFGVIHKDAIQSQQDGFDKVRFRIDYLSLFFANKSKLSQLVAFPDPKDGNKTIYQINYHNEKEEILSFWLDKYKITICSRVTNYPTGSQRFEKNQLKIDVTEDFWIDITKNKGVITEEEIFRLQAFLERYFSFCLNSPIYTQSVTGFIDNKPIDLIFRKAIGDNKKVEAHKIIYTYDCCKFLVSSMNRWWLNREKYLALYGWSVESLKNNNRGLENLIFNNFQAIENYLNVALKRNQKIKRKIYNEKYKDKVVKYKCDNCDFKRFITFEEFQPKIDDLFSELIESSSFLNSLFEKDIVTIILDIRNDLAHADFHKLNFGYNTISKTEDRKKYLKQGRKYRWEISSFYCFFAFRKITKYCILKTLGFTENQILTF